VCPHHHSAVCPHHQGAISSSYISFAKSQLLDSSSGGSSGGGRWIGDYQHRLLLFLTDLEEVRPRDLVPHFCSNPKSAYAVVRRLEKQGVLRRVARGVYRVVKDAVKQLLKLPVRHVRGGARRARRSAVRNRDGTTPAKSVLACARRFVASPLLVCGGSAAGSAYACVGRSAYLGLFLDNVRWCGLDGRWHQLPRAGLLRFGDLDPEWLVVYAEVTHVVGAAVPGGVLDGVVVVYTNVEDFRRFGMGAVRVEWRPPSGYVRRNGVASSLLMAREELVKAFRALAVVLGEALVRRRLSDLYSWLGRLWGMV